MKAALLSFAAGKAEIPPAGSEPFLNRFRIGSVIFLQYHDIGYVLNTYLACMANGTVRKEIRLSADEMSMLRFFASHKGTDIATLARMLIREQLVMHIRSMQEHKWPVVSPTVTKIISKM